jgi:hypothetical protein
MSDTPWLRHRWPAGAALASCLAAGAWAQAVEAGSTQRGGTFVEPPVRVDPLYTPRGPDQPDAAGRQPVLALRLSLELPLRDSPATGQGTQGSRVPPAAWQAQLRWRPLADPGWFVQLNGWRYLDGDQQRPWDPDLTFAVGYDDGAPGRWSFSYANYTGTRLSADPGRRRLNVPQGQWTLGWRFALPGPLEPLLLVGDGDAASCRSDLGWTPRFARADGPQPGRDKWSLGVGCRYTRPGGWFAQFTALAWPVSGQQQPWDPDYTYGVGWIQPQAPDAPGSWSVQYANYSGNRWPGRPRAPGEGSLRSGSLSVGWSTAW